MALIEEFLVGLGFQFDGAEGERFIAQTETVSSGINRIAISAGVALTALTGLAATTANVNDDLGRTATSLGLSVEELAAWQFAAQQAGITGDSLTSTLSGLQQAAQEAIRTGSGPFRAFSELGVDFGGIASGAVEVTDALEDIITRAQQLDRATAQAGLRELGIDVRFLDTPIEDLRNSVEEGRNFGQVTEDLTQASQRFTSAWGGVQLRLSGIANQITQDMLPALTSLTEEFADFVGDAQTSYIPRILELVEAFGGWENVIAGLAGTAGIPLLIKLVGGLGAAAAAIPALFIAAAVGIGGLLGLGAAVVSGNLIGGAINENLTPEQRDTVGREIARVLAFFGNEDAAAAFEANEGVRPTTLADITPPSGSNPALRGSLRGQGFQDTSAAGQPRQVIFNNNFSGLTVREFEAIIARQEAQAAEVLANEAADSIVR